MITAIALRALLTTVAADSAESFHTDIDATAWTVRYFGPCLEDMVPADATDPGNPSLCIVATHAEIGTFVSELGADLHAFAVWTGGEYAADRAPQELFATDDTADMEITASINRGDYCRGMLADDEITVSSVCR